MTIRRRRPLIGCLAVLTGALALAGCTNASQQAIDTLRKDPMATVSVPGLLLVSEHQSSVDSWKNPPASFTRCFQVDGITADEATAALGDLALANGWQPPEGSGPVPTAFDKLIDFGDGTEPADPRDTNASLIILTDPGSESGCPLDQQGNLALVLTVGGSTYWSPPN